MDNLEQLTRRVGLGKESRHASVIPVALGTRWDVAVGHDDRHVAGELLDFVEHVSAGLPQHGQVEHDDSDSVKFAAEHANSLAGVDCF